MPCALAVDGKEYRMPTMRHERPSGTQRQKDVALYSSARYPLWLCAVQ